MFHKVTGADPHRLPSFYRNRSEFSKYMHFYDNKTFQVEIWPISRLNDSETLACVGWRFWSGALSNKGGRGQRNREEIGAGAVRPA